MAPWMAQPGTFVFNQTISADVSNYVLTAAAAAAGWDGKALLKATITINTGIVVSANNTANPAFDTGVVPAGSTLELVNNGYIIGMGGAGAPANSKNVPGLPGGPALRAQAALTVTNNGTIGGGGGGGGCACGVDYAGYTYSVGAPGGGGQSGRTNSLAGTGTTPSSGAVLPKNGTFADRGAGGVSYGNGSYSTVAYGGYGGTWGSNGLQGSFGASSPIADAPGGDGGAAVVGNSLVTWLATGVRKGAIT